MKRMLVGFVALVLLMVAECPAGGSKSSSTGTTFYVSCTFDDGSSIDGSPITIDTTHGTVLSADLVLYDFNGIEVAAFSYKPAITTVTGEVDIFVYDSSYPGVYVALSLPVTSLKKYAGGTINASGLSYWENGNPNFVNFLTTGHISR